MSRVLPVQGFHAFGQLSPPHCLVLAITDIQGPKKEAYVTCQGCDFRATHIINTLHDKPFDLEQQLKADLTTHGGLVPCLTA